MLRLAVRTAEAHKQAQGRLVVRTAEGQKQAQAQAFRRVEQAAQALQTAHQQNIFFFGKTSQRTKNALGWTDYIFNQLGMSNENRVAFVQAWGLDDANHALVMNGPHTRPQDA
jgi:glycosyltransferase A (GT-A) superfamily protein (DUF2064 family)